MYFLESGIATVAATADGERTLEIGQIGWDGVSGIHTLHGIPTTPNCTYMQMAGTGLRLPLAIFQEALAQDPALRRDLSYYGHYCELVVTHSALAGSLYVVQQRLARLLLMWHDRLGDENIRVTHEEISDLLGVRRSSITADLHMLEGIRAISAKRGNVRVIARHILEEIAGSCYGGPEKLYAEITGRTTRQNLLTNPSQGSSPASLHPQVLFP